MLFWRSFTHLIGGMGILVFTMAIIPRMGDDTVHIMKAEVPGPVFGKIVSKTGSTARILYIVYLAMWVLTVIFLLFGGMPLFDSMVHGFGAAGTGGFSMRNGSVMTYNSAYIEVVLGIAMILFGVNFNLYFFMIVGNWKVTFKNEEFRWYLGIIAAAVVAISFSLRGVYETLGERVRHVFFTVSSIITTTGFSTEDFGQWPMFTHVMLLLLMFVGAMAGSTGGGLKVSRVVILFKNALQELRRVREPKRVLTTRYENRPLTKGVTDSILKYLVVYVFLFAFLVLAIAPDSPNFSTAFSAVAATINNIGPGIGTVGPAGNYAAFSNFSKMMLSISMLAGRLELYPILLLFMRHTWKRY
jgi:trk system potassium uptake protein TrkH